MKYLLVLAVALTVGCAKHSTKPFSGVIIDRRGVNMTLFQTDLDECRGYSEAVPTGSDTVKGAAAGAVTGGLIGAVINNRRSIERGAGIGAVAGGTRGYIRAGHEKDRVIKNCLRNRGYRVLN